MRLCMNVRMLFKMLCLSIFITTIPCFLYAQTSIKKYIDSCSQYDIPVDMMKRALSGDEEIAYKIAMKYYLMMNTPEGNPLREVNESILYAIELLELAAKKGHSKSIKALHVFYDRFGDLIPNIDTRKMFFLLKCAKQGGAKDWYRYGKACLNFGKNVEGVIWIKKAAEHGYSQSYSDMIEIYKKGIGTSVDIVKAYAYMKFQADTAALDYIRFPLLRVSYKYGSTLSPSQRQLAQKFYDDIWQRTFNKKTLTIDEFIALCVSGSASEISEAIANGCDPHLKTLQGGDLISHMAFMGKVSAVIELAKNGADIYALNDGVPILSLLLRYGAIESIKPLVDLGVNINAQDRDGNTALHWAVRYEDIPVIKALLYSNARCDIYNNNKMTPLDIARCLKNEYIIGLILNKEHPAYSETKSKNFMEKYKKIYNYQRIRTNIIGRIEKRWHHGKYYIALRKDDNTLLYTTSLLGDYEELDRASITRKRIKISCDIVSDGKDVIIDSSTIEVSREILPIHLKQRLYTEGLFSNIFNTSLEKILHATFSVLQQEDFSSMSYLHNNTNCQSYIMENRQLIKKEFYTDIPFDASKKKLKCIEHSTTLIDTSPHAGLYKSDKGNVFIWIMKKRYIEVRIYPQNNENGIYLSTKIDTAAQGWITFPYKDNPPIYILFSQKGIYIFYEGTLDILDGYCNVNISGYYPLVQ